MKSLLILTGIILLSFQINRIIVNNSDKVVTASDVKILDDKLITKNDLPEIAPVYRSAKSIRSEAKVSAKAEVKTTTAVSAQKSTVTKAKAKSLFSKDQNNNFRMLHKLIKASGNYISMSTVQFDFNQFDALDSESFQVVMKYADQLVFDESLKVSIAGFTDSKGAADYNEQLSWMRANDVRKYFIELGVKESQIMISANGIADPVGDNKTFEGRAMNRRVEMALIK
ncbi:MAG: OmpA family protein [Chitinophagaceae bacterium]|nr:OmpA family protein [Chitinophagaceae bacterium]